MNTLAAYVATLDERDERKLRAAIKEIKVVKRIFGSNLNIPYLRRFKEAGDWANLHKNILRWAAMEYPPVSRSTGLPTYDDVQKGQYTKKGWFHKVITMTPNVYLMKAMYGFQQTDGATYFKPTEQLVDEYAERTLDGSKIPMPTLVYTLDKRGELVDFTQEGRHRAVTLDLLGVEELPVLVVVRPDSWEASQTKLYRRAMLKRLKYR